MNKISTIVFDLDETLTDFVSWDKLDEVAGIERELHQNIYKALHKGEITMEKGIRDLVALFNSNGQFSLANVESNMQRWLLKEGAVEILEYLKGKGYKLGLISGAINNYVDYIGKKYNFDFYFSLTSFTWNDQKTELVTFTYPEDTSKAKVDILTKYSLENNINLKECAMIGDGENDLGVFEIVETSILIDKGTNDFSDKVDHVISNLIDLKRIF